MSGPRLLVEVALDAGADVTLTRERSHYLCRVLRLSAGSSIELFTGDGTLWRATIQAADPRRCRIRVDDRLETRAADRCRLHAAFALLKGDRLDWVLQKATELGATDIWLLETERTEARVRPERRANRLDHWQGVIRAACEQSRRLRLPELHPPMPLTELWTALPAGTRTYCFRPGAEVFEPPTAVADVALVTGPEGGLSAEELDRAAHAGAEVAGLGPEVLRAETAPVTVLGLVRQAWRWQAP